MIEIFRLLEDGAWHSTKEMAQKVRFPVDDVGSYCEALSKHQIVEYDARTRRVRIGRELANMIKMLSAHEQHGKKWGKMGAGTVVVPSRRRFEIQGVLLQNMTDQDLKIEFTFNLKPVEIVISEV